MTWHRGVFVNWLCRMCHVESVKLNLLTVPPWKHGKYGSRGFARASANHESMELPKGRNGCLA